MFETIFLVISKFFQIMGLQPLISKVFLDEYNNFFLTLGQNNFGNKISLLEFLKQPWKVSFVYEQLEIKLHGLEWIFVRLAQAR